MLGMNRILWQINIKKTHVFMMKMHPIIMILMLIEYYYTKKATRNILLDKDIQIKWKFYHYN